MADYSIQQLFFTGKDNCLKPITTGKIRNISGAEMPGINQENPASPYQQIVLNSTLEDNGTSLGSFTKDQPYYLEVEIPKDDLYDMNFGLHLIGSDSGDLDMQNYQFIRYLNIPKVTEGNTNISRVVLFEYIKQGNEEFTGVPDGVRIVSEIERNDEIPANPEPNEILYFALPDIVHDGNKIGYYRYENNDWVNMKDKWGINDTLLAHSWYMKSSGNEKTTFKIIFTPRVTGLKFIYLYLLPINADTDIVWTEIDENNNKNTYYGRHVDITKMKVTLYQILNLLPVAKIQRFGIWGHSELMFTINGEEIRIGPSGYYELRDFETTFLGVVAQDPNDKFTIDIQYTDGTI